ncbi:partial Sporulation kinase E, partial [Anaerolineae bacterium]
MRTKDVSPGQTRFMNIKPGDHLCCLYESEEEHREIITPFLRQGLERGEKVIYIVDAHTADTVLGYLRDDGVDVEAYLARGQLSIVTRDDTYLREGVFDPDAMIAFLRSAMDSALAEGYPAIRASGEMTWALRGLPGSERLIEYEAKLNHFFPGSQFSALCQYDQRRFDPAILLDVIHTHPIVLIGAESYNNFYFMPPDVFLGNRPAARLQQWIQSLDERKRAEEILRESEERYRYLFDQSVDAVLLTAPDGRILAANPEACRIFGRTEAEICQVGRAGIVDVTDARLATALEERNRTGRFRGELQFVRKDGTRFPGEVSSAIYRDRNGELRTSMTIRDITARERAEEEQRTATR